MYGRITDIKTDLDTSTSEELKALVNVWKDKRTDFEQKGEYQEFVKRLKREWAIETGIVERLYSWDRGITEILIEQGIDASIIAHRNGRNSAEAKHIAKMIKDQEGVIDGLFGFVKDEQPLTEHYIRSIHAEFTRHQDYTEALNSLGELIQIELIKGKYKKYPNNPRRHDGTFHEYCPPAFTGEEMAKLVELYNKMETIYPPEIRAAWIHHRFTQIHPFQDGNGRVARALASLVFLKDGLFPLVIRDSDRKTYIEALDDADSGDLVPLVKLFSKRQKEAILKALGLEQQIEQAGYAETILQSAFKVLEDRYKDKKNEIENVFNYADSLHQIVEHRLREMTERISCEISRLTPPDQEKYTAWFNSADRNSETNFYFANQIIEIARKFDYYANLDRYRAWSRLHISTDIHFEYVLSIHGFGASDSGIMVASAFTSKRVERESGEGTEPINTQPAGTDIFQFNYAEPLESIKRRFGDWLEASLSIGLAEWKRQLELLG